MNQCDHCSKDLTGTRPWAEVTGWVKLRQQGGANQVISKKFTGKQLCNGCIEIVKAESRKAPKPLRGQLALMSDPEE